MDVMKWSGILVGIIGAVFFATHLAKVALDGGEQNSSLTEHWLSIGGGIVMFFVIVLYGVAWRAARKLR